VAIYLIWTIHQDIVLFSFKNINKKVDEQKRLTKDLHSSELKIQELEHKIAKYQTDSKTAAKQVRVYLKYRT
jgi:septal ring factor EnvC (AmiA/AmiB activator)